MRKLCGEGLLGSWYKGSVCFAGWLSGCKAVLTHSLCRIFHAQQELFHTCVQILTPIRLCFQNFKQRTTETQLLQYFLLLLLLLLLQIKFFRRHISQAVRIIMFSFVSSALSPSHFAMGSSQERRSKERVIIFSHYLRLVIWS